MTRSTITDGSLFSAFFRGWLLLLVGINLAGNYLIETALASHVTALASHVHSTFNSGLMVRLMWSFIYLHEGLIGGQHVVHMINKVCTI